MLFLVKQQNEKEKKKEKGKGKVEDKMAKMNDASPTPFFLICWCLTFDVSVSFFFSSHMCAFKKKKERHWESQPWEDFWALQPYWLVLKCFSIKPHAQMLELLEWHGCWRESQKTPIHRGGSRLHILRFLCFASTQSLLLKRAQDQPLLLNNNNKKRKEQGREEQQQRKIHNVHINSDDT